MSLILRNVLGKMHAACCSRVSQLSTAVENETKDLRIVPMISTRSYIEEQKLYRKPRQVWLENLDTLEEKKLGLVTLHPDIFGAQARIDILHQNVRWQRMYRFVCYEHAKTRAEMRGGGRKPWPQKGLGKARHGSIRSPLWKGGGIAHGPRAPKPHFYMLPYFSRVLGLTSALSVKLAQDDLHLVNNLEIPTDDSNYIQDLVEKRNWGPSVLFVDSEDIMPKNLTLATDNIKHINLMPSYGLNVYSMLKHDTLVLTERGARVIEEKILFNLNRMHTIEVTRKFKVNQR